MRFCLTFPALALSVALLLGCTNVDMPQAKSTVGRAPQVAEVPDEDETVRGPDDPPIVTLDIGSGLRERRLARTEELPGNIIVPTTNLNAVPVTAALQAVLSGTDVSLSWEAGTYDSRLVTVTNLSGPLPKVVAKICASAKVFCVFRNGLLELKDKETFVIDLPSVPTKSSSTGSASGAATNTMAETIGELAGEKVRVDQQGGNLLYTTDVEGYEKVSEYLSQLRRGRPLLVMQLYIWEVALDRDNGTGINWKSFKFSKFGGKNENVLLSGLTGFSGLASPGVSLGAKLTGQVDADMVLQFLETQGQVQTISSPQLTFVSGSNAEFRVGGEQRYISQVGQLTTGSVSGSTSTSTGIGSNTVSTDSLETGLTVKLGGAFESGVISAFLELEMQDVVSLNPTTMENGVIVDLPETSERKVQTSLRVRPGDNLVLAGLVSSRDTNDRDAVPLPFGLKMPTFSRDQMKNSELVILVKPSIVLFREAEEPEPVAKGSKKKTVAAEPVPDAVMIDKDGAKTVKLSGGPVEKTDLQPVALVAPEKQPELMVYEPPSAPLSGIPVAPSADGAPVDRRLLQRGFSHAYDEMLAPVPGGRP